MTLRIFTLCARIDRVDVPANDETHMTAIVISGVSIAKSVRADCRARVEALMQRTGVRPGLAVLNVGDDPASAIYIRNKIKACGEVGIKSVPRYFDRNCAPDLVIDTIERLNDDPSIHGILVQLPLPPQFKIGPVLRTISPDKDVDGFHLYNVGGLGASAILCFRRARPTAY